MLVVSLLHGFLKVYGNQSALPFSLVPCRFAIDVTSHQHIPAVEIRQKVRHSFTSTDPLSHS